MIYTITFSPSLDYVMQVDNMELNKINRSKQETFVAGGKGINVSVMLSNLGVNSVALGFVGGFIGDYIEEFLNKRNIETDFVKLEENSRINVKIRGNNETAINGNGPSITNKKINELLKKTLKIIDGDYLIISGSVPSTLPPFIYELILNYINRDVNLIIDCEKLLLKNTLKYKPFLIKPNKEELEDYFNEKLDTIQEISKKCKILQQEGAQNVIVSLGKEGAFMLTKEQKEYFVKAPSINLVSSVGAGDSLIAGFLAEYTKSQDLLKALNYGVICGSATAQKDYLATLEDVEKLLN